MNPQNSTTPTLVIAETPIRHDVAGRYCLNDLHQASGGEKRHQPSNFLRSDQAADLIAELSGPEGGSSDLRSAPVVTISGGVAQGTYVVKELVYAYAMWISARFHLEVIRAYDRLVTGQAAEPDPAGPPIGVFTVIEAVETARHPEARAALHGLLANHCRAHGLYVPVLAKAHGRAPRLTPAQAEQLRAWFWRTLEHLPEGRRVFDHSRSGAVEAYRMYEARRAGMERGDAVPSVHDLGEALRGDPRFIRVAVVNSRLERRSVKCWLFRTPAGAAPALVH